VEARDYIAVKQLRVRARAGFTVVGRVWPVFENSFSTVYESVIVFGKTVEVSGADEKYTALYALAEKYLPEHIEKADEYIKHSFQNVAVYRIEPERMSGKARRSR
jgi:nitroimidazol reductase NimA-like FMN-containing flavoprotein (pyridoxamine 5'-phosphate oxidase superfamily)